MAHDLKMRNLRNLMLFLLARGEMTKMDLVQQSGLSPTTVSDLINTLRKLHIVRTVGTQKSTGGRQPVVYGIHNDFGVFIGVLVGREGLRVAVTDMYARPVYARRVEADAGNGLLYTLHAAIDAARAAVPALPVLAIGMGISGRLDVGRGVVLENAETGWQNVPLREILERRFHAPVLIDNASNQGALYQQVLGHARHLENFLCCFASLPGRGALVMDGRLCRGGDNACVSLAGDDDGAQAVALAHMLGIGTVLTDQPERYAGLRVVPLSLDEAYFETAAALTAEVYWFERIYAMLAQDNRTKGERKE